MKNLCLLLLATAFVSTSVAQRSTTQTPQQPTAQTKALEINGQIVPGAVIQINGHTYADLLAISQLTGAALTVRPDRIVLAIPNANAPTTPPQRSNRLSKEFSRAAIGYLADLREWRNAVETAVSIGAPESRQLEQWLRQHRSRAEESLRLAGVAASTPADRSALQQLQSLFANMQQWDSAAAQTRQNLDASRAVDPNGLSNDPLLAKINECDRFLDNMLASGTPVENTACR